MRLTSILIPVLLGAAVAALPGCDDAGRTPAELHGYRVGPGDNQITVLYGARPGDGAGAAEVLAQDATRVKVRVTYRRSAEPQDDILQRREAVATLEAPLGARTVVDETGAEVPRGS